MKICAKYNGLLYDANIQKENKVVIRTFEKAETDSGFFLKKYPDGTPVYVKHVNKSELEELYEEHEFGTYRGIEFSINGGTEKTYTIWYWNKDDEEERMCKSLGMELYERGIYVKEVQKSEIINYRIEKEDLLNK